ncbi:MAG: hypothetical protein N2C14_28220 [Planctomycetales bacterium]
MLILGALEDSPRTQSDPVARGLPLFRWRAIGLLLGMLRSARSRANR